VLGSSAYSRPHKAGRGGAERGYYFVDGYGLALDVVGAVLGWTMTLVQVALCLHEARGALTIWRVDADQVRPGSDGQDGHVELRQRRCWLPGKRGGCLRPDRRRPALQTLASH
jgi:hypothetical protein